MSIIVPKPHKINLVVALECSFLHNNLLQGTANQSILSKIIEYLSGFCGTYAKKEDTLTLCFLNTENHQHSECIFKYEQFDQNLSSSIEQSIKFPTVGSKPFSLYETFQTCHKIAANDVNIPVVAIMFCSSNSYVPLVEGATSYLNNLRINPVNMNVIDIDVDYFEPGKQNIKRDCSNLGITYHQILNIKSNLSSTFKSILSPLIPDIWVLDTNVLIRMSVAETKKIFHYIKLLGHLVCFPRRVLVELDGLKKKKRKKVVDQQQLINSLGSLRYNEDVTLAKEYVKSLNLTNVSADEEIILNSKFLKDFVCENVMILSYDEHVHAFSRTYSILPIYPHTIIELELNGEFDLN